MGELVVKTPFVERLASRKWLLAATSVVFFAFVGSYEQMAQVVIAYLAVQAGVDAFADYTAARSTSVDTPQGD